MAESDEFALESNYARWLEKYRLLTRPTPDEQQGEPACGCGLPVDADIHQRSYPDGHWFGSVDRPTDAPDEQQGEPVNFVQIEGDVDSSVTATTVSSRHSPAPDDGEARGVITHRGYEENEGWWWSVNYSDGKGFTVHVPNVVEAAIRAPLEERIRELEAERDQISYSLPEILERAGNGEFLTGFWAQRIVESHNKAKAAEAENERLREMLELIKEEDKQ